MANAEEFFDLDDFYNTVAKSAGRMDPVKRSGERLFVEVKIKMVMRLRGVSRARAIEIIEDIKAGRWPAYEKENTERGGNKQRRLRLTEADIQAAEEFFN